MTKRSSLTSRSPLTAALCLFGLICLCATQGAAQDKRDADFCDGSKNRYSVSRNGKQFATHHELREKTLPADRGTLSVDGRQNGGVRVEGWDRNEVLVRACIQAAAETDAAVRDLVTRLRINTEGNRIFAEVPGNGEEDQSWSVSYQVFVPRAAALDLKVHNGGIGITNVKGQIRFAALNGGVSLRGVGGSVRGQTTNGGLSIELAGATWDGEGLDVRTTNGGVRMTIPENYSARLETGTVNGGIKVDFPITVQGRIDRQLAVTLGSGGATLRATTTNGGVSVKRRVAE